MPRTFQSLPWHKPSRSDKTGNKAFYGAIYIFCIHGYRKAVLFSCQQSTLSEECSQRGAGCVKIRCCHAPAGNNDNIIAVTDFSFHEAVIFLNQTPHTVARNGIADFFTDGNTQAALAVSVFFEVHNQKAGRLRTAFVIQTSKFMILSYRYRLFHTILRTKNLSTSASSSCKNLTAVCRAHSFSEAMLLLSVPFGRLICLKHDYTSFCILLHKQKIIFVHTGTDTIILYRSFFLLSSFFGNILNSLFLFFQLFNANQQAAKFLRNRVGQMNLVKIIDPFIIPLYNSCRCTYTGAIRRHLT